MYWKTYHLSQTVSDALLALAAAPGSARVVAGGTDLLLDLQQGRHPPVDTLVDVTAIPEMTALEVCQDRLYVGAAVPLNRIVASELVRRHALALVDACALIGGPQVRNTATLGGNVAHALPAADGTIALLALGAMAEIAEQRGTRQVPVQELFLGPGRSSLDPQRELLLGFYLPLHAPGTGSAHVRIMRPQGVAIAILNLAVALQRAGDRIAEVRIAVGPAGPTPFRGRLAEEQLRNQVYHPSVLGPALEGLLAEAHFRTSPHRSTAEYRRQMAGVLLEDALRAAWERSFVEPGAGSL